MKTQNSHQRKPGWRRSRMKSQEQASRAMPSVRCGSSDSTKKVWRACKIVLAQGANRRTAKRCGVHSSAWRCRNLVLWGIPLSCGPWSDCSGPLKNAMAFIFPIEDAVKPPRPFGPGWTKKGSSRRCGEATGNDSRVGSTKPRNTTRSSWKKGEHNPSLCSPAPTNQGDLSG